MRKIAPSLLILATAILALAGTACGTRAPSSGEARLTLDGSSQAVARRPGAGWRPAADGDLLARGTQVKVRRGEAGLSAHGGLELRLRAGSHLMLSGQPELRAGALLVEPGGDEVVVRVAGSTFAVAARSAAKLSRSLAASATVYRGRVTVASAGRTLEVPALRTAALPALGLVPTRPAPAVPDATDDWDATFLGLAMDMASQLEAGSNGFTAQVRALDDRVLRSLLPDLPVDPATRHVLARRRPGEQLVAGAIATAHEAPGVVAERLVQAFAFRDEGASWGLVALDQQVDAPARVVDLVQAAIVRWVEITTPSPPAPTTTTAPTAAPTTVPAAVDKAPSTTTTVKAPTVTVPLSPSSAPTTVTPPVTVPGLPPTGTPVDDVVQALKSAVGAVSPGSVTSGGGLITP